MKKLLRTKKFWIMALTPVVLAGLAYGGYVLIFKDSTPTTTPSTTQEEDAAAISDGTSAKNAGSQSSSGSDKQTGGVASGGGPAIPSGNFVSNHRPGSVNDTIESVCVTPVGASCDITFRSGGVTKSLGKKQVNASGATSWIWSPASIALSSGSWQIIAQATYNDKVAEQIDPLKLEIN